MTITVIIIAIITATITAIITMIIITVAANAVSAVGCGMMGAIAGVVAAGPFVDNSITEVILCIG